MRYGAAVSLQVIIILVWKLKFYWSFLEGNFCVDHPIVKGFEILNPPVDSIVTSSVYYSRTVATVSNIKEFQTANSEYSFCIRSYLLSGHEVIELIDIERLPLVFEQCNLEVFDEHPVPGYSLRLGTPSETNQTHLLMVSIHHKDDGLLCQSRMKVICMKADENTTLKSTDSVEFVSSDGLKYQAFLKYITAEKQTIATTVSPESIDKINIVVGIKSCALNAELRQAIRDSWLLMAKKLQHINIIPYFIIGDSRYARVFAELTHVNNIEVKTHADSLNTIEKNAVHEYLLKEQVSFQDTLLVQEIPVEDSYYTLPQKVLHFINFVKNQGKPFDYLIVCDDDVFIDVQELETYLMQAGRSNFYAGEVLEYRNNHVYKPQRDPTHANYLASGQYPSSVLPPFALGNFYILSQDVVSYVGRNVNVLKPVGTLEDLSMGVWLMSLQVFPIHLPGVCTPTMCLYEDSLFQSATSVDAPRMLALTGLRSGTLFSMLAKKLSVKVDSLHWWSSYRQLVNVISEGKELTQTKFSSERIIRVVITPFTIYMLRSIQQLLHEQHQEDGFVFEYYMFNTDQLPPNPQETSKWLLPKYYSRLVNGHSTEINNDDFDQLMESKPDNIVLVTGILDVGAIYSSIDATNNENFGSGMYFESDLSNQVLNYIVKLINAKHVIFVSGEPVDLSAMRLLPTTTEEIKLTVLNTVTQQSWQVPPHSHVSVITVYMPNCLTSLDEMEQSAKEMPLSNLQNSIKNKMVAYLYHRCDRNHREIFFNLLSERLQVHLKQDEVGVEALGVCNGGNQLNSKSVSSRLTSTYLQEAVELYAPFKFVIAFENTQVAGYITEKLTNAYLAGSIPIYYGAPDVEEYFDASSMINCNRYSTLLDCAERVVEVHLNDTLYAEMRSKIPTKQEIREKLKIINKVLLL